MLREGARNGSVGVAPETGSGRFADWRTAVNTRTIAIVALIIAVIVLVLLLT